MPRVQDAQERLMYRMYECCERGGSGCTWKYECREAQEVRERPPWMDALMQRVLGCHN
jgi:hypothetical protein